MQSNLKLIRSQLATQITPPIDPSLSAILQDLSSSESRRRIVIHPIKPEELATRCTCGHLLRYHELAGSSLLFDYSKTSEEIKVCKYHQRCKCKGYKQSQKGTK